LSIYKRVHVRPELRCMFNYTLQILDALGEVAVSGFSAIDTFKESCK